MSGMTDERDCPVCGHAGIFDTNHHNWMFWCCNEACLFSDSREIRFSKGGDPFWIEETHYRMTPEGKVQREGALLPADPAVVARTLAKVEAIMTGRPADAPQEAPCNKK